MQQRRLGDSRVSGAARRERAGTRLVRLAWIPLPLFIVLFALLHPLDTGRSFEPRLLLPVLNLVLLTGVSFVVAWRAAHTYLAARSVPVLAVACGSLAFGLANLFSAAAAGVGLPPDAVAGQHNAGALIAGACYVSSALLMARPSWTPSWRPRPALVSTGLAVTLPLLALAALKFSGSPHPAFFTHAGPTVLRQYVLGSAIACFALAGILAWVLLGATGSRFVTWYSLGLLLIAAGLAAVFFQTALGTISGWAGRSAQYLGCVYLLVAVRTGPTHAFPLVQLLWETRDRYRRLVELSPDAILVHSDGKYVFANPAAVALFGARSTREVVGLDVLQHVHPDSRATVAERIQIANEGAPTPRRDVRLLRVDQSPVDVETSAAPVEFMGRPAIQVVMRDITDRKRSEEKIREATLEAERRAEEAAEGRRILDKQAAALAEANRLKDEFLATLSHELRTPLNAILGWSHMLVRRMLAGEASQRAVEAIHRNAEAQVALINDVLDVSRIVSGKLRLEMSRLNIAAPVQNALVTVRPAAMARQIEIVDDLQGGAVVLGDGDRLQQVFWNLLSNALKFTGVGGRVTLSLTCEGGEVSVCVHDTGSGIAPEFLPRVFERFSQADGSTTRAHGGLGLGLAIVRHLVELHGGRVKAESEGVGRGAAFTVTLPVAPSPEQAGWLDRSEFGPRVESAGARRVAGVKVLVADDEADARDLLEAILVTYGAQVRTVGSAAEALTAVSKWRPDVLLSDIGMPGEDGYELMRRLRALPPDAGGLTPAIAVTSYGRSQDRVQALSAGYTDHLVKPVVPGALAAAVASVLGKRSET